MEEQEKQKNNILKKFTFCFLLSVFYCLFSGICFAQDSLSQAKVLFLKHQYVQVVDECQKVITNNPNDPELLAEADYFTATSYINLFDFLSAKKNFKAIVDKYKNTKYYEDAYVGLGDIELLQENFHEAIKLYTEFLLMSPSKKRLATLYFRLADVNHRLGNEEESKKYLNKLQEEFPLSFEASDAKRLAGPEVFYTVQVGAFTNYDNAEKFLAGLKSKGYEVYSVLCMLSGKKLCRVRVGKFKTRKEAESLKERLEADGYFAKIFP